LQSNDSKKKHAYCVKKYKKYLAECRELLKNGTTNSISVFTASQSSGNSEEHFQLIDSLHNNKTTLAFFIYCCPFIYKILNENELPSGAFQLYLYCGLMADYSTGFFEADFKEIAKDLKVSERHIYSCFNLLEKKDLVLVKKENRKKYVFISPYPTETFSDPPIYNKEEELEQLSKKYRSWIRKNKKKTEGKSQCFFFLPRSFLKCMTGEDKLSPGAIKLYVYCGIVMDKMKGYTLIGLDKMSKDLGVHKRTVSNWFMELNERKLIERHQMEFNGACCTHIMPYKIQTHKL